VSTAWITILLLAAGTVAIKAAGPIALGGHALPPRLNGFIMLLAPSLLAALVAVETLGGEHRTLVVDARLAGLAAAGIAIALRRSMTVVVIAAAIATAITRAIT
jgi:branched-subunit amino acid transport protein